MARSSPVSWSCPGGGRERLKNLLAAVHDRTVLEMAVAAVNVIVVNRSTLPHRRRSVFVYFLDAIARTGTAIKVNRSST
jgi:hypothetical protein